MSHPHPPPQSTSERPAIEREFELERMILFSDAVFAIAITLMAIDIRWPEMPEKKGNTDLYQLFGPTILEFGVFILSFFFIGRLWASHLKLFRLLKNYDKGLINLNLFLLFFVVIFPFTASGMLGHFRSWFIFPLFLYLGNIAAVFIIHAVICRYIFRIRPALSVRGQEEEKRYIYMRAMYIAAGITITLLIMVLVSILFPGNVRYLLDTFLLFPLLTVYSNKKTGKYKPKTSAL